MVTRKQIQTIKQAKPPLRELNYKDQFAAINYLPGFCKVLLGIETNSTVKDIEAMVDFVRGHFQNLNARELVLALELYSSGEIVIPKEKEHFGKLHLAFLGAVFSAFEKLKQDISRMPYENNERALPPANDMTLWKADYVYLLNWIKQDGKIPEQANFYHSFQFLKNIGTIQISKEAYQNIIGKVNGMVNDEIDKIIKESDRKLYRIKFTPGSEPFKNKCREEYLRAWLQDRVTENNGGLDKWIESEIERVNAVTV